MNFCRELYGSEEKFTLLFLPNYLYSVALAKLLDDFDTSTMEPKIGLTQLCKTDDIKLSNIYDMLNNPPDVFSGTELLTLAILLYPQIIKDIIEQNDFNKSTRSLSIFSNNQNKSYKEMLEHNFWKSGAEHAYWTFLQLSTEEDLDGLKKIQFIYLQKSLMNWKHDKINLWVKSVLGFILNQIDDKSFDYEEFIAKCCTEDFEYRIPFELRRYAKLNRNLFLKERDTLDVNNIL